MAKTIAVVGATGTQGGSVVKTFLSLGWKVRGITRSSRSSAAQALASQGVDIVTADLDDPSSLIPAFSNAEVVFAVTEFWGPFADSFAELSKISDRATGKHAYAIEVQRGKNLIDAAAQVAKDGVLERFIWSTLPDFLKQSKGKYDFNYHFDGKAAVSEYLKTKKDLWEKSSLFNAGLYTTNMLKYKQNGGVFSADGTYVMTTPASTTALHPLFVPDDTGVLVELLVRSPPKQDLLGVSEMANHETYIKTWSEATGVPGRVEEVTVEEADRRTPGGLGREAAETMATSAEFGWGDHLILPKGLDTKIKLTSLKEYMEIEDWSPILSTK